MRKGARLLPGNALAGCDGRAPRRGSGALWWLAQLVAVAMVIGPDRVVAQTQPPGDMTLLRCADGSNRPCAGVTVDLSPDLVRRAATLTSDSLVTAWRARFLADTGLLARARRGRADVPRDNRLLILVDISGTMKNLGIGTVKLALQDLLSTFDSLPGGAVRIAIAPFGSVAVADRIGAARFTTPDSARLLVDALPTPDRENTGLYSAVELGIGRVAAELKTTAAPGIGVLMLVTDGTENDVGRPGDDPGLLAGDEGLKRATRAVDQSGLIAAIIGIGAADRGVLSTLAGARGRKYLVGLDAYQLAAAFREIRDLYWSSWDLVIPLPGSREALGRGVTSLSPHLLLGVEAGALPAAQWRPPVVALPAFAGVAAAALVPSGTAEPTGFVLDRRLPLALMVVVLIGLLWLVVPRLLWPPLAPASSTPTESSKPAKAVPAGAGGLRTDVKEVGPRRPTDVTAAKARRAR